MWAAAVHAITAANHLLSLHQNAKNGKTAVSLQWLKRFALSVDERMTTEDVVQKVIIPATFDLECRYVDILDPAVVGPPSCFVSHRWGANFRELTKVLLQHFADEDDQDVDNVTSDPFVWLDIFAILQHKTNEQTSDLRNLQNVIAQSSKTLLVLDDTGQVLRRVWCLFEIWKTVSHKSVSGLVVLARDVNLLGLKKIFTELNVAEAEATVEEDRIKILADIESSIGIEELNGAIRSALVQSTMLEVSRLTPRRSEKKHAFFRCIGKASQMCALAGLYSEAQPLMIEALELSRELVGEHHELTASSYNNMAGLLRYTGKFSRAEPHQRRSVEISEAISGNSARTRIYLGNLGQLLQSLGRLTEAETYLLRALSIPQANAGDLSTPHLLNSLASLYMDLGRPADALPLYKKALECVTIVLSASDPEVAVYMANLAGVHVELKSFVEAEKLQRKAIEICERALGREHPTTAGCINNLAEILAQQKKLIEAHSLANEAYCIRLKLLGESHNSTANSLNNLAGILVELKRYEDAEPLMRKSLEQALNRSDSEKGRDKEEDTVTASRMHNLARVLDLQADSSQISETAELYKKALAIREKLLGVDHAETTATASSLASFYSRSLPTCLDQASQLYQRVVESYRRQGSSSGPRLLNALNHWAMCHHKNGRNEEAAKVAEQAIALASQLKGPSSPEVEAFKKMREALLSHVAAAATRKQEEKEREKPHPLSSFLPPPQMVSSVPPQLRGEASSFSPFFSPSSNPKGHLRPIGDGGEGEGESMEASLRGHLTAKDKGEPEDDEEDIWPSAAALANNQKHHHHYHHQAAALHSLPPPSLPVLSLRAASSSILSPTCHSPAGPNPSFFSPSSSRPSPSSPFGISASNSAAALAPKQNPLLSSHSRPPSLPSSPLVPTTSNYFASILAPQAAPTTAIHHHDGFHDGDRSSAPSLGARARPKASDPHSPLPGLPNKSSSPTRSPSRQAPQAWMPSSAAPNLKMERSAGDLMRAPSSDYEEGGSGSKNRPSSLPRFDRRSVPIDHHMKPMVAPFVASASSQPRLSALVSPPRPNRQDGRAPTTPNGGSSYSFPPSLSREASQTKLPGGSPSSTRRPSKVELMMKAKLQALEHQT